ncbi:MAG TPA: hypothetical protein DCG54_02755 [Anaerolineae bacterium]|jgi:hypothetical protein|nr:hypothetical protein [Anaerolineae bacterium]
MSQNFAKEYWIGRAIGYTLFAIFVFGGLVLTILGLFSDDGISKIKLSQAHRDLIVIFYFILFFTYMVGPGLTIWKSPQFAQGWLSAPNKRIYASVPWDELSEMNKAMTYATSLIALVGIIPLGTLMYHFVLIFISLFY